MTTPAEEEESRYISERAVHAERQFEIADDLTRLVGRALTDTVRVEVTYILESDEFGFTVRPRTSPRLMPPRDRSADPRWLSKVAAESVPRTNRHRWAQRFAKTMRETYPNMPAPAQSPEPGDWYVATGRTAPRTLAGATLMRAEQAMKVQVQGLRFDQAVIDEIVSWNAPSEKEVSEEEVNSAVESIKETMKGRRA